MPARFAQRTLGKALWQHSYERSRKGRRIGRHREQPSGARSRFRPSKPVPSGNGRRPRPETPLAILRSFALEREVERRNAIAHRGEQVGAEDARASFAAVRVTEKLHELCYLALGLVTTWRRSAPAARGGRPPGRGRVRAAVDALAAGATDPLATVVSQLIHMR